MTACGGYFERAFYLRLTSDIAEVRRKFVRGVAVSEIVELRGSYCFLGAQVLYQLFDASHGYNLNALNDRAFCRVLRRDKYSLYSVLCGGYYHGQRAVDAANDQLAILYTRVDTPGRYCWVVYSLSEAKALPEETVTLQPLSYGGETESYPLRKDVTPEVRVRNLSRLQPLARFSIPTPAIAWQGYEIHDGRMYLMEGTSGNNDGTTGEAYMTVYDFEGRIVQSRTKVRAVSDLKALTEAGITESGYIESEGVKIRRGKLFLGFASQSKKDGNRRRANIFQYELP